MVVIEVTIMVDPRETGETGIIAGVQNALRGCKDPKDAVRRIKDYFSPEPALVRVSARDSRRFTVLIRPYVGAEYVHMEYRRG